MNDGRRYLNALMITGVAATTALIGYAAPAGAEGLDVGSDCPPDQIGVAATANDGTSVRCIADERGAIHWLPRHRCGCNPCGSCKLRDIR